MTSPKGEGQGPFRMGPHRPPPYTPSPLHPASDSLAEGGQRRLPKGNPLFLAESLVLAIPILTDFDIPMPKNLNLAQIFVLYILYISVLTEF